MDRQEVAALEAAIETALRPIVEQHWARGERNLPPRLVHLMAKGAVAVLEAAEAALPRP